MGLPPQKSPTETYADVAAKGSYADAKMAPKLTLAAAEKIIEQQADQIRKLQIELHQERANSEWLNVQLAKTFL